MTYTGGKNQSGTYQTIINEIPPHEIYVELFAGSAAIYFNKMPAAISILCELDRAQFNNLVNPDDSGLITLNIDVVPQIETIITFLSLIHELQHPVFLYLDPPYPINSRSSQRKLYNHEMSDADHIRLLYAISSQSFPIAISTYSNPIYSKYLAGWRLIKFQAMSRQGPKEEYLYMNYAQASQIHDYRYIGKNFREREKFSKIKNNVVSKFSKMPDHLFYSILKDISHLKK